MRAVGILELRVLAAYVIQQAEDWMLVVVQLHLHNANRSPTCTEIVKVNEKLQWRNLADTILTQETCEEIRDD